jgi:hypothetical protein
MSSVPTTIALEQGGPEQQSGSVSMADDGHTQESACLNCGTALIGAHCHQCGQHRQVHRTLGGFFHDLLHGALHFEGKVWRTLPMLAWQPGRLTREYIEGRRARHVGPVSLFLFGVFAMFTVQQVVGTVQGEEKIAAPAPPELPAGRLTRTEEESVTPPRVPTAGRATVSELADDPEFLLYKLKSNFYKFSWLLIPLSTPVVWLLFAWRRRFGLYDHAVFVTHSICFVTLLYTFIWILEGLGLPGSWRLAAAGLIPPVHIYRQLRGAYELRPLSALWRTGALMALIPIILGAFVYLLWMIGKLG